MSQSGMCSEVCIFGYTRGGSFMNGRWFLYENIFGHTRGVSFMNGRWFLYEPFFLHTRGGSYMNGRWFLYANKATYWCCFAAQKLLKAVGSCPPLPPSKPEHTNPRSEQIKVLSSKVLFVYSSLKL